MLCLSVSLNFAQSFVKASNHHYILIAYIYFCIYSSYYFHTHRYIYLFVIVSPGIQNYTVKKSNKIVCKNHLVPVNSQWSYTVTKSSCILPRVYIVYCCYNFEKPDLNLTLLGPIVLFLFTNRVNLSLFKFENNSPRQLNNEIPR